MKWYHYIAALFAGFFVTNAIPHGVAGLLGETFPTPFADPPGFGHSSPLINVLWSLANVIAGYCLLRVSQLSPDKRWMLLVFLFGAAVTAIVCSLTFEGTLSK